MATGLGIGSSLERPDRAGTAVSVLHASTNRADLTTLRNILRHTNWTLFQASSVEDARECIRRERISVIICDYEVCAKHWKELFDEFCREDDAPMFVVSSARATDDVRAEALHLGAQEVLATPFDSKEVYWVVSHSHLAWQHVGRWS